MHKRFTITYRVEPDGMPMTLTGREAWALQVLAKAGEKGVTPIENPAPRWSGYVHVLRKNGVTIETIHEKHDGRFPGTHGRYVLRSAVTIEKDGDDKAA